MYSAKINGEPTTFGTSGLLYRSNKLMYDRTTETIWSSLVGEPVIGPLADSGMKLQFYPVLLTTANEWIDEHPETTVLSIETGIYNREAYRPEIEPRSAYFDYRNSRDPRFAVPFRDDRLGTKEEVLGISHNGSQKAYPVAVLNEERVVNDVIGDLPVVVFASSVSSSARVYERGQRSFALEPQGDRPVWEHRLVDTTGEVWEVTDDGLVNITDRTRTLTRVPANISFWFAWFAFYPNTEVYGSE